MKTFGWLVLPVMLLGSCLAFAGPISENTQAQIRAATSAAPPAIAAGATVLGRNSQGHTIVLRQGHNGWTCRMTFGDPERLPVCFDANYGAWVKAFAAGRAPDPDKPGFAYMLQGGSAWSNTDPKANALPPGRKTDIHIPPHVMIMSARIAAESGFPSGQANPDTHKPFVMFGGTKYAILIIPVH